jgi:hypothetical protein
LWYSIFIVNSELSHTTLQPISVQEWVGEPYADVPLIPGLDIDVANYRYVSQGSVREVTASGTVNSLGSAGFSLCSGLLMTDAESGTIAMAHFEPHSEHIIRYLEQKPKDRLRQVALFYGNLSVRHWELENLISRNYFGPIQHKTAHFESGNATWGMAFNRAASNQVKIFTRRPSQAITTFAT